MKDFKKMNEIITQYCNIGYDECQYICELYNDKNDSYHQDARKIAKELDCDLIVVLLILIRYKSIENDISFKKNHPDDIELHDAYDFALDMQNQKPYSRSMAKAEESRNKERKEKTMKKSMSAEEKEELMPEIYKRYMNGDLPEQMSKDYDRSSSWISGNLNEWVYNNITDEKELKSFEAQKYHNRTAKAAEGRAKKAAEKEAVVEEQQAVEQPKDDTVISLEEVARAKEESAEQHHKNKLSDFWKAWMLNCRQIESMAYEEGMTSAALKEELYKYGETVELQPDQIDAMIAIRDGNKKASYDEWLEMYLKVKAGEVGVYDAIDELHMSLQNFRDYADAYERGEMIDAILADEANKAAEAKSAEIVNIHVDNCWNNLYNLRPLLEVNLVNDSLAARTLAVFATRSKPNENEKRYKEACEFLDKHVCSYDENGNCTVNKELCVDAYDKDSLYMIELINACISRNVVVTFCVHDHNGRILYNERVPRDQAKDLFNVFGNATRVDAVDMTLEDIYAADELYEVVRSINTGSDDTYIWKILFADQESALKYQKDTYFEEIDGSTSETSYAYKCKMVDGKLTDIGSSLGGWFSNLYNAS